MELNHLSQPSKTSIRADYEDPKDDICFVDRQLRHHTHLSGDFEDFGQKDLLADFSALKPDHHSGEILFF